MSVVTCTNTPTGLDHLNNSDAGLAVYPNPAGNEISIQMARTGHLYLYDVQGRLLLDQKLEKRMNIISISELAKGMYLLKLEGDETVRNLRLLKE